MMSSQIFGFIGTTLVVVAYIPQIKHLIKEHCSAGISCYAYTLWFLSAIFLLIHSYLINDQIFVILQVWNIVASGIILRYSMRYKHGVCESHSMMRQSIQIKKNPRVVAMQIAIHKVGQKMNHLDRDIGTNKKRSNGAKD